MIDNENREQPTDNGKPPDTWLICPICKKANTVGTLHCKYCWGASLFSVKPVTTAELAEFTAKREKQLKKFRLVRSFLISISAILILAAVTLFWMFNFTDLVFKPKTSLSSAPSGGDWSMYRYNLSRSGSIDNAAINTQGELKWSFQTGGTVYSSPTVVGGIVYVGSSDNYLYAIDAATGIEKWKFKAGSWIESSPAVVNGIVYFGSNDQKVYALDAQTGDKIWEYKTRYAVKSSPAVAGNIVYIGSDDYSVYALDARTGNQIWEFKTGGYVMSSPAVSNGIVYVGSADGFCYAINAENGRFRLKMSTLDITSSPAVQGSTVYFTSRGYLQVMNGEARNWPREQYLRPYWLQAYALHLAPPPPPRSGVLWGLKIAVSSSSTTPVIDGNDIYTTGDNKVMRIDLTTRAFTWTKSFVAGGIINSSPALANKILYVGCDDGRLYAIDAETGKAKWNYLTGGKITASPAIVDGVVFISSWDGKIYAIK